MEIKKNTDPARVYKKNLKEEKIPIIRNIGINKLSKKI